MKRVIGTAVGLSMLATAVAAADAPAARKPSSCRLGLVAELKVEFRRFQPLTRARVNGRPVRMLLDTGAFSSAMWTSTARDLGLAIAPVAGLRVVGVGGFAQPYRTTLAKFEIAGVERRNLDVLVIGEGDHGFEMIMGRDFLGRTDVEFDLAHGVVRLLEPKGCQSDEMPYWAEKGYSQAPMRGRGGADAVEVDVKLNGRVVHAILDSGAAFSVATPNAALRSGVKLGAVTGVGRGVANTPVERSVGLLDSFTVGDETIGRTKLRVGDLWRGTGATTTGSRVERPMTDQPEMLLGADFLRAHRVLISPSKRMIYFTYEGGPVFDVTNMDEPPPAAAQDISAKGPG